MTFRAIIAVADSKATVSGHLYPKKVLEQAFVAAKDGPIIGRLSKPDNNYEVFRAQAIAFTVKNLEWDGPFLKADINVLPTVDGEAMSNMINGGVKLRFGPAGIGTLNEDDVIQEDYQLLGFEAHYE